MFVLTANLPKLSEQREARRLRRQGEPLKRIAATLGVSVGSVHKWCKGIQLTAEQRERNRSGPRGPQSPEHIAARSAAWRRTSRERRWRSQLEGRQRARRREPLHLAGSMLYWAEGSKGRNSVKFVNAEPSMIRLFVRFLRECFQVSDERITLRLNVYTGNGLALDEIEDHWLDALALPRSCLRGHTLNHQPTSSSGQKKNRLPFGVAHLQVLKSTALLQHILGAIQEYAGFDEPRWLGAATRKSKAARDR